MFRLKELLKSETLSKNELAFIGCFSPFIVSNTLELKIDDEYITLEQIGKMIQVGKNTIPSVLDNLESNQIIKVVKRHRKPPIIYFNPFLFGSNGNIEPLTIELFHNENADGQIKLENTTEQSNSASKGEIKIFELLTKHKIKFEEQFTFDDCKFIDKLKFDFALFESDKLTMLIEYDGEQHFSAKKHFGGDIQFEKTMRCDQIKNQYCIDNNIKLYRIPYWKFDEIKEILHKLINNEHVEVDETSFLIV